MLIVRGRDCRDAGCGSAIAGLLVSPQKLCSIIITGQTGLRTPLGPMLPWRPISELDVAPPPTRSLQGLQRTYGSQLNLHTFGSMPAGLLVGVLKHHSHALHEER